MAHLTEIHPTELTEADLLLLDKVAQQDYYEPNVKALLKRIASGEIQVWHFSGSQTVKGLAGTSLRDYENKRELWVHFFTGEGLFRGMQEVRAAFQDLARRAGCQILSCSATRPSLARLYQDAIGQKPRALIFSEEL